MQPEVILPFATATVKQHPELRQCGVYAIRHRQSGKLYVGSTSRPAGIVARLSEHRSRLNKGRHANRKLQLAYNKHGAAAFDFLIVEYCTGEVAKQREQHWLDETAAVEHGYNVLSNAQDYRPRSVEVCRRLAEVASKPFELEFGGAVFAGVNLTAFCEERELHQGALTQVLLGKKPQYKGWTLPGKGVTPTIIEHRETGEIAEIPYFGGTQFAKDRGLNAAHFNGLLRGRFATCKGWKLKSQPRCHRKD